MNDDTIVLKNGLHVKLEWSFLILEYIEEYPGGARKMMKDIKNHLNEIKINNYLCYAVIKSNINEPLTYQEILKLLDLKCMRKILNFVEKNQSELEEFKKKDPTYLNMNKKKRSKNRKK